MPDPCPQRMPRPWALPQVGHTTHARSRAPAGLQQDVVPLPGRPRLRDTPAAAGVARPQEERASLGRASTEGRQSAGGQQGSGGCPSACGMPTSEAAARRWALRSREPVKALLQGPLWRLRGPGDLTAVIRVEDSPDPEPPCPRLRQTGQASPGPPCPPGLSEPAGAREDVTSCGGAGAGEGMWGARGVRLGPWPRVSLLMSPSALTQTLNAFCLAESVLNTSFHLFPLECTSQHRIMTNFWWWFSSPAEAPCRTRLLAWPPHVGEDVAETIPESWELPASRTPRPSLGSARP